jgi:hypothetical protein
LSSVWGNFTKMFFSPLLTYQRDLTTDGRVACTASWPGANYTGLTTAGSSTHAGNAAVQFSQFSQFCDIDFPLCVGGGIGGTSDGGGGNCTAVSAFPWHSEGMPLGEFETFMSWLPLVAGSLGAIVGGITSDQTVKRGGGARSRVAVILISNLFAAPFCYLALVSPYPWCFVSLIGANLVGEMWIGATMSLVLDLVPSTMRTTSIALYLFFIFNIGGNAPGLVNVLARAIGGNTTQTVHVWTTEHGVRVDSNITLGGVGGNGTPASFTAALKVLYPGVYVGAAVMFLAVLGALVVGGEGGGRRARGAEEYESQWGGGGFAPLSDGGRDGVDGAAV